MKEGIGNIAPFGLRMLPGLRAWLKQEAARTDRSVNYIINAILTERMKAATTGASLQADTPAVAQNTAALQGGDIINPDV